MSSSATSCMRRAIIGAMLLVAVLVTYTSQTLPNRSNEHHGGLEQTDGFGANPFYYQHWCGQGLQYLSDGSCAKKFPGNFTRQWQCATASSDPLPAGYFADTSNVSAIVINQTALRQPWIPFSERLDLSAILVRRSVGGVFYRYVSNGNEHIPVETWSSSKIFAMADAAGTLQTNCSFGLDAATTGKHGWTQLGDLATIVCSYDTTANYTSNSLAKYFATVGGKARLNWLVQSWLQQQGTNQSLGGSYGENPPADLGYTFYSPPPMAARTSVTAASNRCSIAPDFDTPYVSNTLSMFSMSEMTRRLVMYRDVLPANRFPGMAWSDVQDELYGAEKSTLFPGVLWGGMSSDPAIFVQSGTNITDIQQRSHGQWRIFSKLGAGYSTSRDRGEITNNAYACFPIVGSDGSAKPGGVEFVLSARVSVPFDKNLVVAQYQLQKAIAAIVAAIVDGRLQ
jgi:hypothetical protein